VKKLTFLLAIVEVWTACGPVPELRDPSAIDLVPPVLLGVTTQSAGLVLLRFDDPPWLVPDSVSTPSELRLTESWTQDRDLHMRLVPQSPGKEYVIELRVRDEAGNSNNLVVTFRGHNGRVPSVLINEFTTRGSKAHPDMVEIKVLEDGNMGGVVAYQGTPDDWSDRFIFPALEVQSQDFLILHFRPQGLAEEIDEVVDRGVSGGIDASPLAYDFWIPGATGLSGNNGVVSVYERVGGSVLDAVLYSNRSSDSDTRYGGFGTRETETRALAIVAHGGWFAEQQPVRPEDAVNPEGSTATRSLCRRSAEDTNTRHDWYIVPTRGSTFGAENGDEEYKP
jgi:hypothetical protein